MPSLAPSPRFRAFTAGSSTSAPLPLVGGKLYTYAAGTTTPKVTYRDSTGLIANTNPVILNARGEADVWLGAGAYKFVLTNSAGAQQGGPVDGIEGSDNIYTALTSLDGTLRADLARSDDGALGGGMVGYSDATPYTAGRVGRRLRDLGLVVSVPADGADATAGINTAILRAFQSMAVPLTANEVFAVRVGLEHGKDYSVLGTLLLPPGIVLDLNGSRLTGPDASAGTAVYSPAGHHMFRTARWTGTAIESNAAAASETVWRVVGAGVVNGTLCNTNCPLDMTNLQEQAHFDGLRMFNVAAPMRLKNSFYLRIGNAKPLIVRNSAMAVNQPAVLLHGAAAHALDFDINLVGASIGYEVTVTVSSDVEINGSLEEGYARNSIGIRANGSYCQAWRVNAYVEDVRIGITTANAGYFFASTFSAGYFNSTEYALLAEPSSFRNCTLDCSSIPDGAVGRRNLVDLRAANNDVRVRVPSKTASSTTGVNLFPAANFLLGPGCAVEATSVWVQTSNNMEMLSLGDGALVNKNQLMQRHRSGRQIVTVANEITDASIAVAATTITLDYLYVGDQSDIYFFNFVVGDSAGSYVFQGRCYGQPGGSYIAYLDSAPAAGRVISFSKFSGYIRVVISGLATASYIITGQLCVPG